MAQKLSGFSLILLGFWLLVGTSASSLAESLRALNVKVSKLFYANKIQEAMPIAEKAVEIARQRRGRDDRFTATSFGNLANLYYQLGKFRRMPEPLYLRELRIREKAEGPEHLDTATCCYNLGNLYSAMSQYSKADIVLSKMPRHSAETIGPRAS